MAITVEAETQKSDRGALRIVYRRKKCTKEKKEEHQVTSNKRRPNPIHRPRERTVMRAINSLYKAPIIQMIENRTLIFLRLVAGQPEGAATLCTASK